MPCSVQSLAGCPEEPGSAPREPALVHVRIRGDGTPLVSKVLVTPQTLFFALVLLPFELPWLLSS